MQNERLLEEGLEMAETASPPYVAEQPHELVYVINQEKLQQVHAHQCWVYSCGSLCSLTFLGLLLLGIFIHVWWLGFYSFLSIVPSLFFLYILYWRRYRSKAPLARIVKYLAFGMLGVIPVIIVELVLTILLNLFLKGASSWTSAFAIAFFNSFFIAALCEETCKYLIALSITRVPGYDTPYSVMLYSVCGAIGLATIENMQYVVVAGLSGNVITVTITTVIRAFLAVPLHTITGIFIGCSFARGIHNYFRVLLIPFIIHGLYDFFILFVSEYFQLNRTQPALFLLVFVSVGIVIAGGIFAKRKRAEILALEGSMESLWLPQVYAL